MNQRTAPGGVQQSKRHHGEDVEQKEEHLRLDLGGSMSQPHPPRPDALLHDRQLETVPEGASKRSWTRTVSQPDVAVDRAGNRSGFSAAPSDRCAEICVVRVG